MSSDNITQPESYDIGYGKPPRSGCFKKGQRANPRGRPKRSKTTLAIIQEEASRLITVQENGRTRKMPILQVGARAAFSNLVKKPDLRMIIQTMKLIMSIQGPNADAEKEKMAGQEEAEVLASLMEQFMREVVSFGGAIDAGQVTFPLDE